MNERTNASLYATAVAVALVVLWFEYNNNNNNNNNLMAVWQRGGWPQSAAYNYTITITPRRVIM